MKLSDNNIRLRFAPSPTGYLHVGGARTALYNWLYARKMGGKFILRIEDTDQARSTEEALQMQLGDLKWLGLNWDEGPEIGGSFGPYKQSERLGIYKEHAEKLIECGKAYYCFCTDTELEAKKQLALQDGHHSHYDGTCRKLALDVARARKAKGESSAIRFNIGEPKDVTFRDLIRDEVTFPSGMVGDFIILRSDGMPVYNFCCVVDDALMKISHVLRAEEHLNNTVRQIMLYEAFGFSLPLFGHLSFILGPDRQKLSKRHGATSCNEYRKLGYLPEALKNYIALLGWSSPKGQEIISEAEMIEQFSLDRFTASPAVFDDVKVKWVNATHMRATPNAILWTKIAPFLKEAGYEFPANSEWQDLALTNLKPAMETIGEAVNLFRPLSVAGFEVLQEADEALQWPTTAVVMACWREELESFPRDFMSGDEFIALQDRIKDKTGTKGKNLFQAIRVAVLGRPQGTELKLIVPLIPKNVLIARAKLVLTRIGK